MQVLGDLRVVSYWIDTLVLKNWGNTYATLLHHPFLFKENQRKLKTYQEGFLAPLMGSSSPKSIHTKYPSQTLIPRITLFSICLSFSSPPLHLCRFICPFSVVFFRLLLLCLMRSLAFSSISFSTKAPVLFKKAVVSSCCSALPTIFALSKSHSARSFALLSFRFRMTPVAY